MGVSVFSSVVAEPPVSEAPILPVQDDTFVTDLSAGGDRAPAVVVDAQHLSKQFIRRTSGVGDLRELFNNSVARFRKDNSPDERIFQALHDVSFQVTSGQTLGIVGHNGSGKSTLLKMLTGILKPTTGSLKIQGRIGALIEVGAGFHPDLSGRENVYLNGSIMGLSRRDLDRRMDTIVSFAGLEKSIDQPVKRYSSGQYMRLGFSVAAHTDPDIMLIDEVLAVGDTQFQRKCLRHLKEFANRGGTVIFVSHAMGQVTELCKTCLWLDHGQVLYQGDAQEAVDRYMALVNEREDEEFRRDYPVEWEAREAEKALQERQAREADQQQAKQEQIAQVLLQQKIDKHNHQVVRTELPCLRRVVLQNTQGDPVDSLESGAPLQLHIDMRLPEKRKNVIVGVEFFRDDNLYLWGSSNYQYDAVLPAPAGEAHLIVSLSAVPLPAGDYFVRASLFPEPDTPQWDQKPVDVIENAARLRVTSLVKVAGCVALPVTQWQVAAAPSQDDATEMVSRAL